MDFDRVNYGPPALGTNSSLFYVRFVFSFHSFLFNIYSGDMRRTHKYKLLVVVARGMLETQSPFGQLIDCYFVCERVDYPEITMTGDSRRSRIE